MLLLYVLYSLKMTHWGEKSPAFLAIFTAIVSKSIISPLNTKRRSHSKWMWLSVYAHVFVVRVSLCSVGVGVGGIVSMT